MERSVYLDCNATTPIEPIVRDAVLHYMDTDYGNAGSRTHEYGAEALKAVNVARDQIANVVRAHRDEVILTSGATESNNLALIGLAKYGESTGRKHIVSTGIEHKAVLEPLEHLASLGFEITLINPSRSGWIDPDQVKQELRDNTLLVSVMHVNNETGVIQPLDDICNAIGDHPVFFHCDAAQGFGKELEPLKNQRIDFISVSGHKIYGPKGIGALILRKRGHKRPPVKAILYGGGQERGLRPGTLPVHLIAGLGLAAEIALTDHDKREAACLEFKEHLLENLGDFSLVIHGDPSRTLYNTINLSIEGLDSEAVMLALKDLVAISNGSACTSMSHKRSHVLKAMGVSEIEASTTTRWSWCHMTKQPDWDFLVTCLQKLL